MSSEDVRDTLEGDEQENQQQQQQQHLLDSSPAIAQQIDVTSSTHTGENQENSAAQSSPEKPTVDSTVSTSTAAKPTSCANGASIDDTTTSSSQIAVKPLSNSAAGDGLATAAAKESELDETAPTVEPSDTPASAVPLKTSIPIKVTYKRNVLELSVSPDDTVEVIKKSLESLTDVPVKMQKLMYKGIASNEKTIRQLGVPPNSKFLLIGSTQSDVQSVSRKPSSKELREPQVVEKKAQPLSERRPHSKILGYGVPADAYPGILHVQEPLPRAVHGMLNKVSFCRMNVHLEICQ